MEMTAREKLRALLIENPELTTLEAVNALGISRQRLHLLVRSEGISLKDGRVTATAAVKPGLSHIDARVGPKAAGGISELLVAVDLLRRGLDVYQSMTTGGQCDLVAINRATERVLRVEVKSAKRHANGKVMCSIGLTNKFDVLAKVLPNGEIVYEPDIIAEFAAPVDSESVSN